MSPGVIGSLQANETIALAGIGEPLVGRLLFFDALSATFTEVTLAAIRTALLRGEHPTVTEYIDYASSALPDERRPHPTHVASGHRR